MNVEAPILGPARPIEGLLERLKRHLPDADDVDLGLLVERAAIMNLPAPGRISANGTCRLMEGRDGWIAVNLPRREDLELLPAWLYAETVDDPWEAIRAALMREPAVELACRGQSLGLAVALARSVTRTRPDPAGLKRVQHGQRRTRPSGAPIVIDLSSLWAGPLCAHLLGRAGARVIKVECVHRPDGARRGAPEFYDLLHAGHESVALDLHRIEDRMILRRLIDKADVVIEASRPRALRHLGIDAGAILASKSGLVWVGITAYGREGAAAHRIGFGDDVAAAAGLLGEDERGDPVFLTDATADPLTGLAAAVGAFEALEHGGGCLVDVPMAQVAAALASGPILTPPRVPETPPRRASAEAAPLGRDTRKVLREFGLGG